MRTCYNYLLFDLDGTLTDPIDGIGRSINYALTHFGYAAIDRAEQARCIGPKLYTSFKRLTGSEDEAHIVALVEKYRERYADVGYAENALYPGIPEALAQLAAQGVHIGLCTSKRADYAERILAHFGIDHYFAFVDGGDIHIEKWQQIGRLLAQGQVAGHGLMIGDRDIDMIAAQRNGLAAAGVLWGYGSHAELSAYDPAHLLDAPPQLAGLPVAPTGHQA